MAKICKFLQTLEQRASELGMDVKRDIDGKYKLVTRETRALVGRFDTEKGVRDAISELQPKHVRDLDGGLSVPAKSSALSVTPPKIQDQLVKAQNFISSARLTGAIFTPIKRLAQEAEKIGQGPIFSKVYETTQKGKQLVDRFMGNDKITIPGRSGKFTYNEVLREFEGKLSGLPKEQRELVTLYLESFTKSEIVKPGVFLEEGIDHLNIEVANRLEAFGVADRIPELLRLSAIIDDYLVRRNKTLTQFIPQMESQILEGKLPSSLQRELDRLKNSAGTEETVEQVFETLELTQDEIEAIKQLRAVVGVDDYNLPAIYRYANAPKLKPGFKDGKAQFATERSMSPQAVALAKERRAIMQTAFDQEGRSVDKLIGAQLPVFRQFIDAGFFPKTQVGEVGSAHLNKYIKVLDGMEEGREVFKRRVLSGHLNPYEMHPTISADKHIRNIGLRKHLDEVMLEARDAVKNIPDERMRRIFAGYLNDLEGIPNESFRKITQAIKTPARAIGIKVDDQLVERTVNLLTRIASQATIPFRAALVARNYLQTLFFTAPVIGTKSWTVGLKAASGRGADGSFSIKNLKASLDEAIKAGAIDPNVVPIHASTEVFARSGIGTNLFGPKLAKLSHLTNDMFDAGFSFYRTADDWGRTVAFFAGKDKVNKAVSAWKAAGGALDDASIRKLKENAKAMVFDETIGDEFERLIRSGLESDAANYIGKQLADKTHLLYGNANHPTGWGGVSGRLFGQFGTFPVQYADFLLEGMTRGTTKDIAHFGAMHLAINAGVIKAGAEVLDADLGSWATIGSLSYSGGPYLDVALNLTSMMTGSDAERSLARRSLSMQFPTFENPESIFVPGSYLLGDFADAMKEDDLLRILGEGAGIRFLKPGQENWVDKALSWMD